VEEGHLAYPYSSREAISIVKHLERFPDDPFEDALQNVFAFDQWSDFATRESIIKAFRTSGFSISDDFIKPPVDILLEYLSVSRLLQDCIVHNPAPFLFSRSSSSQGPQVAQPNSQWLACARSHSASIINTTTIDRCVPVQRKEARRPDMFISII